MAIYHRLIILGICLCISPKSVSSYSDPVINPKQIMIGAVLSSQESEDVFHQAVRDLNRELGALPQGVVFNATSLVMQENPIRAAQSTCSNLLSKQVYTVLASHPPSQELSPIAVSFTCGYYMIPVIGLSARESIFSDKGIHPFFMRTVPPFSEQAEIWVNLVRHFKWKSVIFLHTADHDGRAILAEFQNRMDYKNMKIEKTIALTPGLDSYMSELLDTDIIELTTRVILLYADREDGQNIIRDAVSLNLTQPGYAWIVTEQLLTLPDVPIGFLGASLVDWMEEEKHIRDSLQIIAKAFQSIYMNPKVSLIEAPTDCEAYPWVEEDETVLGGELVYDELIKQVLDYGQTGSIKFSKDGDRVQPLYNIVNIQENGPVVIGKTYVREIRRTNN